MQVEYFKSFVKVLQVLWKCFAINENIIKKDDNEFVQVRTEGGVHCHLKGGRGVIEAKQHDEKLVVAVVHPKGCLGDVRLRHEGLVVALHEIKFGKPSGATQFVQKFINCGDWETILDCEGVQGPIIHTKSLGAVPFFDQQNW